MWRVSIIVYSDKKVVFDIDLENDKVSLPCTTLTDTKKNIVIKTIKDSLSILVEDYIVLHEKEGSLTLLIGEWEGALKNISSSRRFMWRPLKDAQEILTEEADRESLTLFRERFCEVVSPEDETIGIAHREECEKYGLTRRGTTIMITNERGEILMQRGEKGVYSSLFTHTLLGEGPEEAAYRLLSTQYSFLTELNTLKRYKHYTKSLRYNMVLMKGNYGQSLTFSEENSLNLEFLSPKEICKAISNGKEGFSEQFIHAFEQYTG